MKSAYSTTDGKTTHHIIIDDDGHCEVDGKAVELKITVLPAGRYSVLLDGIPSSFAARRDGAVIFVSAGGREAAIAVESEREKALRNVTPVRATDKKKNEIVAPMPALVVRIHVAAGDDVHEGQPLLALEAMKMENEIRSPRSGKVREVRVAQGAAVEKGGVLIVLE